MSYAKTKVQVENLVKSELSMAAKDWGDTFRSRHEGYAVLLEEYEELRDELEHIRWYVSALWDHVKEESAEYVQEDAEAIESFAVRAACEAIQVAAMAKKMQISEEGVRP